MMGPARIAMLTFGFMLVLIGALFLLADALTPGGFLPPGAWWAELALTAAGVIELAVIALLP